MNYSAVFHELETARLLLRRQRLDDAESYHRELSRNPEVAKHMRWKATDDISRTRANVKAWVAQYEDPHFFRWILEKKEDCALIGVIQLVRLQPEQDTCSFAYMLGEDHWRRGYMTEALVRVFSFAFEELSLSSLTADHFTENPASGRVMQKAGMTFTGYAEDHSDPEQGLRLLACYRITREEFLCSRLLV
ncbi:MAG: N-acetyltransferase [Clostridia bacterium]|nr:N-acetyltransferase [Clostridia bacterium]